MKIRKLTAGLALTLGAVSGTASAFNPQPDPPGFGIVSINPNQTIRLNIICWQHPVNGLPPDPCSGELLFHDLAGNTVARQLVRLAPGGGTFLDFSLGPRTSPVNLVGIDPCWIPEPTSGRALPTVEVFETRTGKIERHVNPLTPRISFIVGNRAPD